jgi:hypothetical protein
MYREATTIVADLDHLKAAWRKPAHDADASKWHWSHGSHKVKGGKCKAIAQGRMQCFPGRDAPLENRSLGFPLNDPWWKLHQVWPAYQIPTTTSLPGTCSSGGVRSLVFLLP